jgi:hypothetical protein
MAKPASSPVSGIDLVYKNASSIVVAEQALAVSMRACKEDISDIKKVVYAARMAASLGYSREAAMVALGKKVFNKDESKNTDGHRTEKEEKAYTAARVWMTSFSQRHGFSAPADKSKDDASKGDMDTAKLKTPKPAKIATDIDLAAFVQAHAKSLYDLFLLNKAHKAVTTDMGAELMGLCADFDADAKAICAKYKKA